jgi:hypothetical protein
MNSQLFNYIFDVKEIGLNIIKFLSFKDCIKSFNFITKSTNDIFNYKFKDIFFLVYECNKKKIIYNLDINLNNYLSIPICKYSKLYGKIYIINQNKKINLKCNIIKKNYRQLLNNKDFIYNNNSYNIQFTKIYKKIMKNRNKYQKLFYIGEYSLNYINNCNLKNLKIHFYINKISKNIKNLDKYYLKKYINNIYNYKLYTLCKDCNKNKYISINNPKKIICKYCNKGYIYQKNIYNNY